MKWISRIAAVFVLCAAAAAFLVTAYYYRLLHEPPAIEGAGEKIVEIPLGTSVHDTAELLYTKGLIPSVPGFKLLARFTQSEGVIRAGEYSVPESLSSRDILTLLRKGDVVLHKVTVPEGLRSEEVAGIVAEKLALSRERLAALLKDREFIQSLGLTSPTLEGYLLPETYSFPSKVTEEQVILKMVQDMLGFCDEEKRGQAQALGLTLHQLLTLASIIEKETAVASEAPLVSSVYHNRLKKRMRLQSDPTVIYGIEGFDGDIRWKDLRTDTPYNTYTREGLPPTPIANPGKRAIEAALSPADTKYLYFVSRNDGTHVFSETLSGHNQAVNRYQRRRNR
jgi:UPF0755 protein